MDKIKTQAYILFEKHGKRVVHAKTFGQAALEIVRQRLEEDIYYEDNFGAEEEWKTVAKQILSSGNARWAEQFLEERSDCEYEGFEKRELEFDA